jgi:hypothetical protein
MRLPIQITNKIIEIQVVPIKNNKYKILAELPTRHGYHLISNPFRLDKFKDLLRIRVDDELVNNPIIPEEELKECCVIFDDIDGMPKHISKAVKTLLEILIMQGRHWNTTVIYAGHTIDGKTQDGKKLLNETHYFVYFPWGATRSITYILNTYLDIDKETIKKIKSTHSRWCCIGTNYPQVIITEKNIMMMAHKDDE